MYQLCKGHVFAEEVHQEFSETNTSFAHMISPLLIHRETRKREERFQSHIGSGTSRRRILSQVIAPIHWDERRRSVLEEEIKELKIQRKLVYKEENELVAVAG
ncbi:unnamed protein product [Caenorhabditis brenneri]